MLNPEYGADRAFAEFDEQFKSPETKLEEARERVLAALKSGGALSEGIDSA